MSPRWALLYGELLIYKHSTPNCLQQSSGFKSVGVMALFSPLGPDYYYTLLNVFL